ncbi:MAG: acetyl-CoA carboxylase biotin carboxyl carrier protein, partial [Sciscionella sp.]
MDLDLEELAAIIELLDKADFTDFRFEKGDLRIAVSRGGTAQVPDTRSVPAATSDAVARREQPATAPPAAAPASSQVEVAQDEVLVKSPMLGTFYRSPKPGEAPFVEIGDKVDADTVV